MGAQTRIGRPTPDLDTPKLYQGPTPRRSVSPHYAPPSVPAIRASSYDVWPADSHPETVSISLSPRPLKPTRTIDSSERSGAQLDR